MRFGSSARFHSRIVVQPAERRASPHGVAFTYGRTGDIGSSGTPAGSDSGNTSLNPPSGVILTLAHRDALADDAAMSGEVATDRERIELGLGRHGLDPLGKRILACVGEATAERGEVGIIEPLPMSPAINSTGVQV
jgi:hypothetical protein